jgi:acetylornithine deacetylase
LPTEIVRTLEILERLIAFDTVSAKSNLALVDYAEGLLKSAGARVQRLFDAAGQKAGLYAEIGPAGRGIALSGHTDVVPVEGQVWTRDPFKLSIDQGRAYGRGTTDMKGFVAGALALAERAGNAHLKEPLKIVLSYDEEVGCLGLRDMLPAVLPLIGQPRAVIVGEPTEMQLALGHKGKVALKAVCHGQAGHSAMAPDFVNAIHLAADFVVALRALQADLAATGPRDADYDIPFTTLHVGKIAGGKALNIVPDRAEIAFEIRHLAAADPTALVAQVRQEAERIAAPYRAIFDAARIEIAQVSAYPGLSVDPAAEVVGLVQRLSGRSGHSKVPYGTEAGFFAEAGLPAVVCGPGSMPGQGHKPDEYIELSELAALDGMLSRILTEISA